MDDPPDPEWLSPPRPAPPLPGLHLLRPEKKESRAGQRDQDPLETKPLPLGRLAERQWTDEERGLAVKAGSAVLMAHQCRRCHEIGNEPQPQPLPPLPLTREKLYKHKKRVRYLMCVECHIFHKEELPRAPELERSILARNPKLREWRERIVHLLQVPSLDRLGKLVRPTFLAGFLLQPTDLRPMLEESMIRPNLTAKEIRILVRYFAARSGMPDPYGPLPPPPVARAPSNQRLTMGQALFRKRCASCHQLGADSHEDKKLLTLRRKFIKRTLLAPNLRFVRAKIRPEVLAGWMTNPMAIDPRSAMVSPGVTLAEAEAVKDYLLWTSKGRPSESFTPPSPVAPFSGKVTWEEINHHVIGHVCVHCHMDDNEIDAGPGNEGGLGYEAMRLSFRTFPSIMRGSIGPDGRLRSVMLPLPGKSVPILVERMLLRRIENRRDTVPAGADAWRPAFSSDLRGMPLGLPAVSDEWIGRIWGWIRGGCAPPADGLGLDDMATFRDVIALLPRGRPFFDPLVRVWKRRPRPSGCGLLPGAGLRRVGAPSSAASSRKKKKEPESKEGG